MKKLLEGKRRRQIIILIIDILIVASSATLSLLLRFDLSSVPSEYVRLALVYFPVDLAVTFLVFTLFQLYNRVWTFASIPEAVRTAQAVVMVNVAEVIFKQIIAPMPKSYYIFNFLIMMFLAVGSRLSLRVLAFYRNQKVMKDDKEKIMIVGAGAAGAILIREIIANYKNCTIECMIDDNKNKLGALMQNIKIVGGRETIGNAVAEYGVTEIIIAMPSATHSDLKDIISKCNETGCKVKILPSVAMSLTGSLAEKVRDVSYEDLLGRDEVRVNQRGLCDFIHNKTVLVTGGGGSIGSELCRQIAKYIPDKLIIFDVYENNAYAIQQELLGKHLDLNLEVLIGTVRDRDRVDDIFREHRPDVVFHAAAHKHVPLMETSPNEAIKNNCEGTLNVVRASDKYRVENFILISTDKAVRPTNVMGATKRICEKIVQVYDRKSPTKFAAVRFGNVLGSNGSVIPLFLKQIEKGGPVTVTHKEITRFFMTIPEAVSLVLQAGMYAGGGEIFVLDMGKPVRIYDLAENLVRMKGFEPGKDIKIEITGLRPGEKLYEEILMDEEGLKKTPNDLIYIGQPIIVNEAEFFENLGQMLRAARDNSDEIKALVSKCCTTYKPPVNIQNTVPVIIEDREEDNQREAQTSAAV